MNLFHTPFLKCGSRGEVGVVGRYAPRSPVFGPAYIWAYTAEPYRVYCHGMTQRLQFGMNQPEV
jgi:hypothetical protein